MWNLGTCPNYEECMDFLWAWLPYMMMHKLFLCFCAEKKEKKTVKDYSRGIVKHLYFFCIIYLYFWLKNLLKQVLYELMKLLFI